MLSRSLGDVGLPAAADTRVPFGVVLPAADEATAHTLAKLILDGS